MIKKGINVLFIGPTSNSGGAPRSLISMIECLKNNYDLTPIVITPIENGILHTFCKKNNIVCYVIPYKDACIGIGNDNVKNFIRFLLLPFYKITLFVSNQVALRKSSIIFKKHSIDIIHTNLNRIMIGCLLAKKYHVPHVMHIREFGKEDYPLLWIKFNIIQYFNKRCDAFLAISKSVKDSWTSRGIKEDKTYVVYNGVSTKKDKVDVQISYKKKIRAVFAGTVTTGKGQIQLLKVINKLPDEIKEKFNVDFYGNINDKYFKSLQKVIDEEHIEKKVSFLGHVDNLHDKLKKYNLGFICSRKEAFGRVTIDYMLNYIPVIASNSGANPEIITSDQNGFLYEWNNIDELKDKIIRVYELTDIDNVVRNAYNDAVNKYSAEKNAKEVYKVYKKLL